MDTSFDLQSLPDSDEALGVMIRDRLAEQYGILSPRLPVPRSTRSWKEREHWERVRRVEERLQSRLPADYRKEVLILQRKVVNAFAAPGRYAYISLPLLALLPTDDAVAMIIGHELAHSDLGHLYNVRNGIAQAAGVGLSIVIHHLGRFVNSPENERDADAFGLDLCLHHGYDGSRCIEAMEIIASRQLKWGQKDRVYGPEAANRSTESTFDRLAAEAEVWLWERQRGYPSTHERVRLLRDRLEQRRKHPDGPIALPGSGRLVGIRSGIRERLAAIETELRLWQEALDRFSDRRESLNRLSAALRLRGIAEGRARNLTGKTALRVLPALDEIAACENRFAVLMTLIDRLAQRRDTLEASDVYETEIAQIETALFGAATSESRLGAPRTPTPRDITSRAIEALGRSAGVIEELDRSWTEWETRLKPHRDALFKNRRSTGYGRDWPDMREPVQPDESVRTAAAEFEGALRSLRELQTRVDTDPMGTPEEADADLASRMAALSALSCAANRIDERLDGDIARAEALLASLRERIDFDRANDLAEALDTIRRAARSGRGDAAAALLPRWLASADASLTSIPPGQPLR